MKTYCGMTLEECDECPLRDEHDECTADDSEYNRDLVEIFART